MLLRHFTFIKRCLYILYFSIFLFFSFLGLRAYCEEFDTKELYAKSAVLMDAKTKRILVGKNESIAMPMASTTKIMTCIVALENADPSQEIIVSEYAASMPKVHLGMKEGEKYSLNDLLYSLILESHNDTAVAIAEGVSGSVENFLDLMNQKASEIGCKDSLFLTPNGLDKSIIDNSNKRSVHHTTAEDLARIMCYCINDSPKADEFIKICSTKEYSFMDSDKQRSFNCVNHNSLINMMNGVIAGKTGYTNDAGYCYVGAVKDGDKCLVVSLLACGWPNNKSYKWTDTKKLMNFGFKNYSINSFLVDEDKFEFKVSNGEYETGNENYSRVEAYVEKNELKFLSCNSDRFTLRYELEKIFLHQ